MTTKKRLVNIFAIIILAVFASACVIGFAACGSDGDDITDEDAAALYAAMVKTVEYEGSFTLVNTESYLYNDTETEDGLTSKEKEENTDKYTTSYDSETGYFVDMNDVTKSESDDDGSETYIYKKYLYYVPGDGETLTLYTYEYESDDVEGDTSRTKNNVLYTDSYYSKYTKLSHNMYLDNFYGSKAWTTVKDMEDCLLDGDDGSIKLEKKKNETVYTVSMKDYFVMDQGSYFYEQEYTTVLEFHVNSDGFVTKYSVTDTDTTNEKYDDYYWSYTEKESDEYEISFSFDSKLKLAEKDMADYE